MVPIVPTDVNHQIAIPDYADLTFDDSPITPGDWIGVFYTDSDGELSFGGGVQWNNEVTSIAAWGAEAGLSNGFASG